MEGAEELKKKKSSLDNKKRKKWDMGGEDNVWKLPIAGRRGEEVGENHLGSKNLDVVGLGSD